MYPNPRYVWFDALTNYLTGCDWPSGPNAHHWPASVHIIGAADLAARRPRRPSKPERLTGACFFHCWCGRGESARGLG